MIGTQTGNKMIYNNDDLSIYFHSNCNSNLLEGIILPIKGNPQNITSYNSFINLTKININTFHDILGHPNEKVLRNTAKILDVEPLGDLEICVSCSFSKARRKDMNKINLNKSNKPCERLYADISYVNSLSIGKKDFGFCLLMNILNTNGLIL